MMGFQPTEIIAIFIGFGFVDMYLSHFMKYFGRISWPHKFAVVEIDVEQFFQDSKKSTIRFCKEWVIITQARK